MRAQYSTWWGLFFGFVIIGIIGITLPASAQQGNFSSTFPDTTDGIHVFNDQIDVHHLTDAQAEFAATHYAGTQKLTVDGARRLRAFNPALVVLHYRLGLGLGYRSANTNCQPTGEYLAIIHGNDWVQEWPGDEVIQEDWLYHYDGQRVYWCAWGWYLADTYHPGWRTWWIDQIKTQLADNEANGLFADSVTVPNFLGAEEWSPALPPYDEAFEQDWTLRINDWLSWANAELSDQYALIVNAGQLVTSRETTDYSRADGIMIEGFAGWDEYDRFEFGDWQLQLDRALNLINQDRIVILQSYVWDTPERLWTLANYLLIKGSHTYINLDVSQDAEWFPEYDLPIGAPLNPPPTTIQDLQNSAGLYARAYSGGLVVANPDPYGSARTLPLERSMQLVTDTIGGGDIPDDADLSDWHVITTEVTQITLDPGQAAILLNEPLTESTPAAAQTTLLSEPAVQSTEQSGSLDALHRDGQTFLTWPELPDEPGMIYQIYRHTEPLTADNLDTAQLIAEIPQGSGIYWTERARAVEPPWPDQGYTSLRNYVISDLGEQLPDGTGLFVWTPQEDGEFYYAIATSLNEFLDTTGPITEHVDPPKPILVWHSADGLSQVYTQFMDYANYNATFDAPRAGNGWLNLPNWEELETVAAPQLQYAYNYWVGLPTSELCNGRIPDPLPLILHIEGWGSRYGVPADALYFCAAHLWADDPNQSWYFGFSATHDYRANTQATSGPIVNFTEERLLRAIHEVIDNPDLSIIDQDHIYAYGHSMGGTGALMLAERYPQIFAAVFANQPMMNYAASLLFKTEIERKWGTQAANFPVEIRGPDAAHLAAYQGTGVWDWQNLGEQLAARRQDDMAFITILHGTQDTVIDWTTVVQPAYENFHTGSRGFMGMITADDHTWVGFIEHPNYWLNMSRSESFPALSNASGSLPIPPTQPGDYNLTLEWSASYYAFAGAPVDKTDQWGVVLRSTEGEQTVDVTPRRLQQFHVQPGTTYIWQNISLADDTTVVQHGTVSVDSDGLITIPAFIATEAGNRLIISPQ